MRLVKQAAKAALHTAGGIHLFRAANASKFRILMYHRFDRDPTELAWQCEYIRRHYRPTPLRDIAAALDSSAAFAHNTVAVTVDDGYADFASCAWPVFRKYAIPVTVYLVSDFLDRKLWLWTDHVAYVIERTRAASFRNLPLTTAEERSRAVLALYDELNLLPNAERLAVVSRMPGELGVALPAEPPPQSAPLSWSEVRSLAREGIEFGAHTRTHPILSRVEDDALRDEIGGSKTRIEEELQAPVLHFCYPNGTARDISAAAVAAVRAAGFHTAVTTEPGLNRRGSDPHRLKRQGADPWVKHDYFAELLAGVRGHRPAS